MNIKKITEDEVRSLWVQRLSDTPNRGGKFGTPGLSAAEIKAVYDALALRIVERYNELVDGMLAGELASLIPSGHEKETLEDLLAGVKSGDLAAYLTVDGIRTLAALAAAFDTHAHEGEYAPLVGGKIPPAVLPADYGSALQGLREDILTTEAERAEADEIHDRLLKGLSEAVERLSLKEEESAATDEEQDRLLHLLGESVENIEGREIEQDLSMQRLDGRLADCELLAEKALAKTHLLAGRVKNLALATEGLAYEFSEITGKTRYLPVPQDALPTAAIKRLGGGAPGANAMEIPKEAEMVNATGIHCGKREGDVLRQTRAPLGVDTCWPDIRLSLVPYQKYTVGFDIYIGTDTAAGDAPFVFGCYRNEEGIHLYKKGFTVAERGVWVRRAVTFLAPARTTSAGAYGDSGALMLGYSGSQALGDEGVLFRNLSLDEGETDGSYLSPEGRDPVPVTAICSHGVNLLPFPYPYKNPERSLGGLSFTEMEDGSLVINGTAEKNVSYTLYSENDGLRLPEGTVYIAPLESGSASLYLKLGSAGDVWRSGVAQLSKNDEYHDRYYAYLYITQGSVLENVRIYPFVCLGTSARAPVPYRAPFRYPIPETIASLPGYGRPDNYLDFEDGCYLERRGADGTMLDEELTLPLDDSFLPGGCLEVTPGGMIEFESEAKESVASTVLFEIKKG